MNKMIITFNIPNLMILGANEILNNTVYIPALTELQLLYKGCFKSK